MGLFLGIANPTAVQEWPIAVNVHWPVKFDAGSPSRNAACFECFRQASEMGRPVVGVQASAKPSATTARYHDSGQKTTKSN